jgi:acetyltransferase-like isoleucine patch superfamily enzyme
MSTKETTEVGLLLEQIEENQKLKPLGKVGEFREKLFDLYRIINAKVRLRHVTKLGKRIRLTGHIKIINNGGNFIIRDRAHFDSDFGTTCIKINKGATLDIGEGTGITYRCLIEANSTIKIGRNVLIGFDSVIIDTDYHGIESRHDQVEPAPIIIEDDVWVGARCIILKGVTIGQGAVIGAGSIVTKDIPPHTLAMGTPAHVVKTI